MTTKLTFSALWLALAAPIAQADTIQGAVTVELTLSDGQIETLQFADFQERASLIDPETPTSLCNPPYVRKLWSQQYFGDPVVAFAELELDFNDYEINSPKIRFGTGIGATTVLAVDIRGNTTPEELAKFLPDVNPELQDNGWNIQSIWDFEPAQIINMQAYLEDPTAAPVFTRPTWINLEYGFETDSVIENVRVVSDLTVPNTYPDPDTGVFWACP